MQSGRTLFIAFLVIAGAGLGCATQPTASGHDGHSHHANHANHAGYSEFPAGAPSSFAERPEVGTHFTCPVSGGVFEMEPRTRVSVYEGRYYPLCCGGCQQDFDANPMHFINALGKAEK